MYLSSLSFGYAAADRACPRADRPTDNAITYATAAGRLCQAFSSLSATNTRRFGRGRVARHWAEQRAFLVSQEPRPKAAEPSSRGHVGKPTSFGEGIKKLGGSPSP